MGAGARADPGGGDEASPGDRLPLVLTVGFTGHRSVDDEPDAARLIGAVFAELSHTLARLAAMPWAADYEGKARLRLLVGGAPGTDRLAQDAWRAGGHGELHAIYPFFDPESGGAATDDPAKGDPATLVDPGPEFEAWTGLDSRGLRMASDQAHGEVGRWLVRHADLLVAWWDGEAGRGLGGVNDTVRRALERGLPVIWLAPDGAVRLISLAAGTGPGDAAEAVARPASVAAGLSSAALADILAPALAPPAGTGAEPDRADALARRDYATIDPTAARPGLVGFARRLGDRTLWRTYSLFERVAGRARRSAHAAGPPPAELADQTGFQRLSAAADDASRRADRLSAIHRSEQLLLIVLATLAVFFGALPSLLTPKIVPNVHTYAAAAEFTLGVVAFAVAWAARRAHRHRRWSDARRLTERLKSALATWPLGFDIGDEHVAPAPIWTEWRARAVMRAAGPRRGWITRARFEATASWAAAELIDGQADYHARGERTAENIERSLGWIENGAFAVLMAMLAAYLVVGRGAPEWFVGAVSLVSAFAPAVAAGCLALEATNGFGELKERNARLKADFLAEKDRLGPIERAGYHHVCQVMRRAAQLRVDDADAWRDRLLRRRIMRGP